MKLETFFEKFDQFADAPDAVAKMRELVLQLAVRGGLVRQDSAKRERCNVRLDELRVGTDAHVNGSTYSCKFQQIGVWCCRRRWT